MSGGLSPPLIYALMHYLIGRLLFNVQADFYIALIEN